VSEVRVVRPAALARIPAHTHAVIEASAGTGKTFMLEHLVVELLLREGVPVEAILVVTFTEKGASELRRRVRAQLEGLLGARPDPVAAELPAAHTWLLDESAQARLRAALTAFDRAVISTIHAFCQRVLVEHAFPNRRLFRQRAVDGREVFFAAYREALRGELATDERLRPFLARALGEGLTVEELGQSLWACAEQPGELLPAFDLDRFTAAAAALAAAEPALPVGLDRRLAARLAPALERLGALLAEWRRQPDSAGLLTGLARGPGGPPLQVLRSGLEQAGADEAAASELRARLEPLGEAVTPLLPAVVQLFLPRVRDRVTARKRSEGLFDFDDMLALVRDSLAERDGELGAVLRRRFRYALIDEFQDTDPVQWDIFRRLFVDGPLAPEGPGNVLYVIGDPKQAIYGFRGADVHTYLDARRYLEGRGGARVHLDENFRSSAALLAAGNRIFDQAARPPFFGASEIRYDHPVRAGDASLRLCDGQGGEVAPIQLWSFAGRFGLGELREALGRRVALEIARLCAPGTPPLVLHAGGQARPVGPADIFVLTRTNFEAAEVGRHLKQAGLPHAFYKQDGLFDRPEAEHVLELLGAVERPGDRVRRLRAWATPFFAISLDDLRHLGEVPGAHPLMSRLYEWHALAERKDYAQLFGRLGEDSGIVRRALFAGASERELTNYLHIFELLLEEAGRTHATLGELRRVLASWIDGSREPPGENAGTQRLESDREAVRLMTIYKAKGLEAPIVFVAGGFFELREQPGGGRLLRYRRDGRRVSYLGEGPLGKAVREAVLAEQAAEDERLMYVALTRARYRLYLPYFPPGPEPDRFAPSGPYERVNRRLAALGGAQAGEGFAEESVACPAPRHAPRSEPPGGPAAAGFFPELPDEPTPSDQPARLRRERRGLVFTSYSRTKGRSARSPGTGQDELVFKADGVQDSGAEPEASELPGGARMGIFLHALLEEVPLAALLGATDVAAFAALPAVAQLGARLARRHGFPAAKLPAALALVHAALAAPVDLGGTPLPGLGRAGRSLRETEFFYPIPEPAQRPGSALPSGPPSDGPKGYVRGFVDFLFEHAGRGYFADWKSDTLADYGPLAVARHVEDHYRLQAQIYSLALVRMLQVGSPAEYEARFGGLLFCFLRGMRIDGDGRQGVHFERPSWDEIGRWQEELARSWAEDAAWEEP
jgi:exodeoxyribonuclease V beta subunit